MALAYMKKERSAQDRICEEDHLLPPHHRPSRVELVFLPGPRRVELRCEIRLQGVAHIFKASFSPDKVSQHRVQPLGTKYQQPEHQNEQYFCAEAHDSPFHGLVFDNGSCGVGPLVFVGLYG